jgi:lysozyme
VIAPTPDALGEACRLARRFEGCSPTPYRDPCGYWTIGYGHLITGDRTAPAPAVSWSEEDCERNLAADMALRLAAVRRLLRVRLGPGQIAALADFAYNLGIGSLRASTLLRRVNDGDLSAAADEFPKWKFAGGRILPGLIRRRAAERALFLS